MASNNPRLYTAILLAGCGLNAAAQSQRPNIVWIITDDHSFQTISAYGSEVSQLAPTPHIDRLADEGARFDDAFVENSLSTPARACLLTGLYSHQSGQRTLDKGIDSTKTFVSELLHDAGYQTAVVGKWHMQCRPKGFDFFRIFWNQGDYYNPSFVSHDSQGKYIREQGYATDLVTEHAVEFLNGRDKQKPFFLLVEHKAPHRTWMPDLKYLGLYDNIEFPLPATFRDDYATRGTCAKQQEMTIARHMQLAYDNKVYELDSTMRKWGLARMDDLQKKAWDAYYAPRNRAMLEANLSDSALAVWKYQRYMHDYLSVIHSVDESVGDIYEYLERNGLLDNTILVYCSDQGFYMGEHGWFDKRFMYEESLRTPLIVRYPKTIKPGTVERRLVQNIDFAPTMLDAAGVTKPADMPGRSILDLFDGNGKGWRKDIYYHYYDYPAEHHVRRHDRVRNDRYKLIHFYGAPMKGDHDTVDYEELYDMKNDPQELNNLFGKKGYEKVTQELQQALARYRKDLKVDEY